LEDPCVATHPFVWSLGEALQGGYSSPGTVADGKAVRWEAVADPEEALADGG